jgi:hypothetical protein
MLMPAADMACAMAFDPEKILATELHIALDENVLPIEHPDDEAQIAEFEGTLDLVMIHSLTEAEIDDWKSYYQVIDADMFRSKFYPLLLMCLNPSLESVKFVLEFLRYGASRSVEYTRKDLPWLKEFGAERTGTPKKAPRAESKPQTEDITREALHLVPPSAERHLAPGSRKARQQGAQRSHGETGTDPLP